jgi:hypothetical protein
VKLCSDAVVTIDDDGGRLARITRRPFVRAYRLLNAGIVVALRWNWRRQPYPDPGCDPFNLTGPELEAEQPGGGSATRKWSANCKLFAQLWFPRILGNLQVLSGLSRSKRLTARMLTSEGNSGNIGNKKGPKRQT